MRDSRSRVTKRVKQPSAFLEHFALGNKTNGRTGTRVHTTAKAAVEQGVVFYLKSTSHVSIPQNQDGMMAQVAYISREKFISAECMRLITWLCTLGGFAACVGSLVRARGGVCTL